MNDRPKRPVETSQEWLRYAEEDFGVAEQEMLSEEPAYHTICFLCQSEEIGKAQAEEALQAARHIRSHVTDLMRAE
jgi:hypothetical protein